MGVVGRVGSGKSSLLAAIAAEMRKTEGKVSHLDRAGSSGLCINSYSFRSVWQRWLKALD